MPALPDLVDWSLAQRVGGVVAGSGPAVAPAHRAEVRRDFREFSGLSDDLVRSFTGLTPTEAAPEPIVLDRRGWIRANIDSFGSIVRPLAERLGASMPSSGVTRRVTSAAVGVQIGILLGYLSQKVLGQYDLVLASESGGKIYYVGPNVVEAERRWGLQPRDFRLWIALHEITHRTQFASVPWLRQQVRDLIARSVGAMELDPQRIRNLIERGRELLLGGPRAWRSANVMSLLMSEEQREVVAEMQALMCVVEGHGTFVMNRIGREQIPTIARMQEAIESRRGSTSGAERVFQRAIGMDMKYEQYALGERFMNDVAERAGAAAVNLVWARAENLPSLEEMRAPEAWLSRVEA